jgi:hypothetical protein
MRTQAENVKSVTRQLREQRFATPVGKYQYGSGDHSILVINEGSTSHSMTGASWCFIMQDRRARDKKRQVEEGGEAYREREITADNAPAEE